MYETETMRSMDALLLELDSLAYGFAPKPKLRALSDALAQTWEVHRGEVLRPGATLPPAPFTRPRSSHVKERQERWGDNAR